VFVGNREYHFPASALCVGSKACTGLRGRTLASAARERNVPRGKVLLRRSWDRDGR